MYKVKCFRPNQQYDETVMLTDKENLFEKKCDAESALYAHALRRLETINLENIKGRPFVFIPKMNIYAGDHHLLVAIYTRYNDRDEFSHGFYVEWVNEKNEN